MKEWILGTVGYARGSVAQPRGSAGARVAPTWTLATHPRVKNRPVLIVDGDPDLQELIAFSLEREGLAVACAESSAAALELLAEQEFAAAVLDLELLDEPGEELLEHIRCTWPDLPCLVLSAHDEAERVVRCMRLGTVDYVAKPFDRVRLVTSVRNAVTQGELRAQVAELTRIRRSREGIKGFLGHSGSVRRAVALLERAASSDVTVLLQGESGTGKEVAARAIHAESKRAQGPFLAINCGAIPEGVIESELFGHERGAFTGAVEARKGCFEAAHGGTILLDEIGELRPDLQVRLLRVLQDRRVQRVGSTQPLDVDVRILAATHRDLHAAIGEGTFREDLFYRLAVFPIVLPPLRERGDDILLLAQAFLNRFAETHQKGIVRFEPAYVEALTGYRWPGNVRELENVIERSVILEDGRSLSFATLPDAVQMEIRGEIVPLQLARRGAVPAPQAAQADELALDAPAPVEASPSGVYEVRPLEEEERRIIANALQATGGNVRDAARRLKIGRATIYRKIERFGLSTESSRS